MYIFLEQDMLHRRSEKHGREKRSILVGLAFIWNCNWDDCSKMATIAGLAILDN